jgi:hypothetical protein
MCLMACSMEADREGPVQSKPMSSARIVEHPAATSVGAADLDGDGEDELIFHHEGMFRWGEKKQEVPAQVHVVSRGDIDGDGLEEAIFGMGMGRSYRDAEKQVWAIGKDGARMLWSHKGKRNQLTDLHVVGGRIYLTLSGEEDTIDGGWLVDGSWAPQIKEKLALRQYPINETDVLVGRVYGDTPKSDGDLRVFSGTEPSRTLETLRGVRAIEMGDLNGDGHEELLVSDGWHFQYGSNALARVKLFIGPSFEDARIVAGFDDDYTVNRLEVHRSGGPEAVILAQGAKNAYILRRDDLGWESQNLGPIGDRGNAVLTYGNNGWGVLRAGAPAVHTNYDR